VILSALFFFSQIPGQKYHFSNAAHLGYHCSEPSKNMLIFFFFVIFHVKLSFFTLPFFPNSVTYQRAGGWPS